MTRLEQLFDGTLPRLVMFDLDGTLIDSVPDLAAAVDRMLLELGRPPAGLEAVRELGFLELDAPTLDAHYAVNLRATALLSVAFAKRITRRGADGPGGRIVNMVSGQENGPMPGELAYAATKGAVAAFTRSLSAEVGTAGITVNAVNPGPTDTGWMDEALKAELLPRFAFGRIGAPEDAARLVAWLATEEAAWITGQIIDSEGGFSR